MNLPDIKKHYKIAAIGALAVGAIVLAVHNREEITETVNKLWDVTAQCLPSK